PNNSAGCMVRSAPLPQANAFAGQYRSQPQQMRSGWLGLWGNFLAMVSLRQRSSASRLCLVHPPALIDIKVFSRIPRWYLLRGMGAGFGLAQASGGPPEEGARIAHLASRELQALRIAVLTIGGTGTLANDGSGQVVADALEEDGHILHERALVPA